jgi:hypothetical protein
MSKLEDKLSASVKAGRDRSEPAIAYEGRQPRESRVRRRKNPLVPRVTSRCQESEAAVTVI